MSRSDRERNQRPAPGPVIECIRRLEQQGRPWSLGAGKVRDLLGLDSAAFYRTIYAAEAAGNPMISLASATMRYSQDNIWEFVALLELFCGPGTEEQLEEAGIFFSHPEQLEIMSLLLATAAQAARRHDLQTEEFAAMLRTFGRYERARDVYLQEFFSLSDLIAEAAAGYCRNRSFGIPELARANAARLLEFFFQKHILEARSLFLAVEHRLFAQAVREGYAEARTAYAGGPGPDGEGAGEPSGPRSRLSAAIRQARRVMDLENRALTRQVLKGQYKRLMKIYHPDINPRGLRRCQEINSAYALLLAGL